MKTYVLGLALHPAARRIAGKRLEGMVFGVTSEALNNAGIERQIVDSVTIAACDELDGRSISSMLLAMPAGAYLKDEIKCADAGLDALFLGAMRIESELHDVGLVVSWNKSSIAPFEDVMRMRCEPFYLRPIGLNAAIADGLFAQAVAARFRISERDVTDAVMRAYGRAASNIRAAVGSTPTPDEISESPYVAVPLREGHQAPLTDGAAAFVLVSERWLDRHPHYEPLARFAGLGWRIDSYGLGRDRLSSLTSFTDSVAQACRQAGLASVEDIDILELDCPTGYHSVAYARALDIGDAARMNPSGGAFAQNPYFCAGLVNAAEAVLQLCRHAGVIQIAGVKRALAHGCHGFAQQGNSVAIFEKA